MDKAKKDLVKKAIDMLSDGKNIVDSLATDLRNEFDDLSEKAQEGEKGQELERIAEQLEDMDSSLDDMISELGALIQ